MTLSVLDAARERPNALALVCAEQAFTFAQLAVRVQAAMAFLFAEGALRGSVPRPVALVGTLELATLELLYALLELEVPALLIHPRWTEPERQAVVARVEPSLVLDASWKRAARPALLSSEAPLAKRNLNPEKILALIATSGTTGVPKLVKLSRRAFTASARASGRNLGWQPDDRWLLCLPLGHVGGLSVVTRCLLARRCVVVFESGPAGLLAELQRFSRTVCEERVTLLSLVPSVLDRWLDGAPAPGQHRLRAVLVGGAGVRPALLDQAEAAGLPVLATYGLTEGCSQVTAQRPGEPRRVSQGLTCAGHALPGLEVRVVSGSLEIRGQSLFSGCFDDPPSYPDYRVSWYATGDRGFFGSEGELYVLGRTGDLIVSGGENVDPAEIEAALESLPGIRQACVVGLPDPRFGQIVAAALVMEAGAAFSPFELTHATDARLAAFKRPRRWARLDALPQTAGGKSDRAAVRASPTICWHKV